ncbi:MAG: hypothetical protein HC800_21535 [Phormidesmis sp. RL_2_1]|nr:hypothetical protein [Phormidesmis sp. RL_2_1]
MPPVPEEAIDGRDIDVGLVTLNGNAASTTQRTTSPAARATSSPVVEAQGWTRNEQGTVQLLADASVATADPLWPRAYNCQAGLTKSSAPVRSHPN